jgi:transcriptional repressor NrdR
MQCPKCHKETTSVIDSRDVDLRVIRRRRECDSCGFRFTTYERIEPTLTVLKRDGSFEPYNRQKIANGIRLACHRCSITDETVEQTVDRIEAKLMEEGPAPVPSKKIGQLVIKELKQLDEVAYLRFISVFKEFKNAQSFSKELAKLFNK